MGGDKLRTGQEGPRLRTQTMGSRAVVADIGSEGRLRGSHRPRQSLREQRERQWIKKSLPAEIGMCRGNGEVL